MFAVSLAAVSENQNETVGWAPHFRSDHCSLLRLFRNQWNQVELRTVEIGLENGSSNVIESQLEIVDEFMHSTINGVSHVQFIQVNFESSQFLDRRIRLSCLTIFNDGAKRFQCLPKAEAT